jgi:hypothetical protein
MKLKTAKKEIWITKKNGDDEADFLVSPLSAKESFELLQKATESTFFKNQAQEKVDFYKLKIMKINKVIRDWRKIEDENGEPLPCDAKMREVVYNFNRGLIDSVLDEADELGEAEAKVEEEEQKNSEAGLNG